MMDISISTILSAVYYTIMVVVAVAAVNRIMVQKTKQELDTIADGFAGVLAKTLASAVSHDRHARRLDVLEGAIAMQTEQHRELTHQHRELTKDLQTGLRNVNERLDNIFELIAKDKR